MTIRFIVLWVHQIVPEEIANLNKSGVAVFYSSIILGSSFAIAIVLSAIDVFLLKRILYRKSMVRVLFVGLLVHVVVLSFLIVGIRALVQFELTSIYGVSSLDPDSRGFVNAAVAMFLTVIFGRFLIEIEKKLGYGNLRKLLMGKFYRPKEDRRIFMFVDLKNSTSIAEKLGLFKYSSFLQDCFNDFSVVDEFEAEIYQYVGDEAVVSWPMKDKGNYQKLVDSFLAFKKVLQDKRRFYEEKYGLFPIFTAGAHAGPIIIAEVGVFKREFGYHGDTINTASRIQKKCNELNSELLMSQSVYQMLEVQEGHKFKDVGAIELRGKSKEVKLYSMAE